MSLKSIYKSVLSIIGILIYIMFILFFSTIGFIVFKYQGFDKTNGIVEVLQLLGIAIVLLYFILSFLALLMEEIFPKKEFIVLKQIKQLNEWAGKNLLKYS